MYPTIANIAKNNSVLNQTVEALTLTKSLPLPWPKSSWRPTCTSKDGALSFVNSSYSQMKQKDIN